MHKLRVSSSNCSSEVPQSGHESSSSSPSKGSLSTLPSKTLSNERVEWPRNSLGFEPLRCSPLPTEREPSMLPGVPMSISRVSRLLVESMETRVLKTKQVVNGLYINLVSRALQSGSNLRWRPAAILDSNDDESLSTMLIKTI